jgi:hypothetical protein
VLGELKIQSASDVVLLIAAVSIWKLQRRTRLNPKLNAARCRKWVIAPNLQAVSFTLFPAASSQRRSTARELGSIARKDTPAPMPGCR